jgi:hypothetical protein
MKVLLSIIAIVIVANGGFEQIFNIQEQFPLPEEMSESSGIILYNGKLVSHNDSGGENALFELDTLTGEITRTVTISNATNVDWEDLAHDESYIYIGDFGNNAGSRTDLRIYKIEKETYNNSVEVTAEVIAFSYADQIDFSSNPNNTEWDAEALISFDENSLMVITKNWIDGTSRAYPVPKAPGTYDVNAVPSTLQSGGRITGATYNPLTDKVYLVGYTAFLQPFVWVAQDFQSNDIFSGDNTQTLLDVLGFDQVEAITEVAPNRYFITSESFSAPPFVNYAKLVSFSTSDPVLDFSTPKQQTFEIYPNPFSDELILDAPNLERVEIYDADFSLIHSGSESEIDVSHFKAGVYLVKLIRKNGTFSTKKIVKQ